MKMCVWKEEKDQQLVHNVSGDGGGVEPMSGHFDRDGLDGDPGRDLHSGEGQHPVLPGSCLPLWEGHEGLIWALQGLRTLAREGDGR